MDAACIAAAREIGDSPEAANEAATMVFYANINDGYLNSDIELDTPINYSIDGQGNITVDISATAVMPTSLIRLFGFDTLTIGAASQAVRRPVDLAFVIDNSSSLQSVGDDVIDRAQDFVGKLHTNMDRVALLAYGHGAEVLAGFDDNNRGFDYEENNSATLWGDLEGMTFDGYTNPSEGFSLALDQLLGLTNPADLRVIVFFTDGAPNTFSSQFLLDVNKNKDDDDDSKYITGSLRASSASYGRPRGLYNHESVSPETVDPPGWEGNGIGDELVELPEYYNAHSSDYIPEGAGNPDSELFLIVNNSADEDGEYNSSYGYRPVSQYNPSTDSSWDLFDKVSRISRNLPEAMADHARDKGIIVFTLGLGPRLLGQSGPDDEIGSHMLYRMANDPAILAPSNPVADSDYDVTPPNEDNLDGIYCHAIDEDALGPCLDEILEVIIRLTM